ncbi:MAG: Gfo/Idh/MocA family protein [Limisphaerales bacterium]
MNRRTFIAASAAIASASWATSPKIRRVAVMGHTGRGNYGHGLDVVWNELPNTQIVGVADANEAGLKREVKKLKLKRGFTDYRKMLREVKPEFVSVAPRHPDQHLEMTLAAIEAGVRGIYLEKPFCRTPREADQILAEAKAKNVKVAVAHRNRYHPVLPIIDKLVADGKIGRVLALRGHGLGDRRGGAEDLWVLGSHIFNLFHYFGGEPKSCSGILLQNGRSATRRDVKPGAEGLGLLAGNEIHARWQMEKGLTATYTTFTNDGSNKKGYAATLVGTKGTIAIHIDRDPVAWLSPGNPFDPSSRSRARIPITSAGLGKEETNPKLIATVHNHVAAIQDLIAAVDEDRSPLCDAKQGAVTVEMICGVFESHRQNGAHVRLPLAARDHPLAKL